MDSIEEIRYPFNNVLEYFVSYSLNPQGAHILITWFVLFCSIIFLFFKWNNKPLVACAILYFSLQQYNNPAFTLGGVSIADFFGVFVALSAIWNFSLNKVKVGFVPIALFLFAIFCIIHASFIWNLNSEFLIETPLYMRYVLVFRIFVVALVFLWLQSSVEKVNILDPLLSFIVFFSCIACIVYLIALFLLLAGIVPFGTYAGAGFSSTFSFGGVSIERGYLSKFMAPLFPFIFLYCYRKNNYKILLLNLLIMLVNFSASGLSFIFFQLIVGFFLFKKEYIKTIFSVVGVCVIAVSSSLFILFLDAYMAIIEKIYTIVILGDESSGGGRSFGLLLEYLIKYPYGIGYSASTFRTGPGLPEINMGIYAFISQLSFFGMFFIIAYIFSVYRCWKKFCHGSIEERVILVGVASAPFVFFSDILWMNPVLWMPLFILSSKNRVV